MESVRVRLVLRVTVCWEIKELKSVKPFAHILALSPLLCDFILGQGSQENEESHSVDGSPVGPNARDSGSHDISEVALLDVEQVNSCGASSHQGGALDASLAVVEPVNNSLILLPLVCFHLIILYIISIISGLSLFV